LGVKSSPIKETKCGRVNGEGLHDLKQLCAGMDAVLQSGSDRVKRGITPVQLFRDGVMLGSIVVAYSGKHTKNGVVMPKCPWCGTKLYDRKDGCGEKEAGGARDHRSDDDG